MGGMKPSNQIKYIHHENESMNSNKHLAIQLGKDFRHFTDINTAFTD